jgi:hypothetical protein
MDELIGKIHIQYLQEEILKMQNTAKGLEKIIDKKDPIKDDDLIKTLDEIRLNTIDVIEKKKKELKNLYLKQQDINNN